MQFDHRWQFWLQACVSHLIIIWTLSHVLHTCSSKQCKKDIFHYFSFGVHSFTILKLDFVIDTFDWMDYNKILCRHSWQPAGRILLIFWLFLWDLHESETIEWIAMHLVQTFTALWLWWLYFIQCHQQVQYFDLSWHIFKISHQPSVAASGNMVKQYREDIFHSKLHIIKS